MIIFRIFACLSVLIMPGLLMGAPISLASAPGSAVAGKCLNLNELAAQWSAFDPSSRAWTFSKNIAFSTEPSDWFIAGLAPSVEISQMPLEEMLRVFANIRQVGCEKLVFNVTTCESGAGEDPSDDSYSCVTEAREAEILESSPNHLSCRYSLKTDGGPSSVVDLRISLENGSAQSRLLVRTAKLESYTLSCPSDSDDLSDTVAPVETTESHRVETTVEFSVGAAIPEYLDVSSRLLEYSSRVRSAREELESKSCSVSRSE